MAAVVLLLQDVQGGTNAVMFGSAELARQWEERNPEVESIGVAVLTTRAAALERSR